MGINIREMSRFWRGSVKDYGEGREGGGGWEEGKGGGQHFQKGAHVKHKSVTKKQEEWNTFGFKPPTQGVG